MEKHDAQSEDCKDYSKREIDMFVHEIKDTLNLIYTQVMKTNGRVTSLEAWRNRIIGAVTVIMVLIVPIVINMIDKIVK